MVNIERLFQYLEMALFEIKKINKWGKHEHVKPFFNISRFLLLFDNIRVLPIFRLSPIISFLMDSFLYINCPLASLQQHWLYLKHLFLSDKGFLQMGA